MQILRLSPYQDIEVEFLVDDGDACRCCILGVFETDGMTIHVDGSFIGRNHSGEDLHEGGLARPVLANDGIDHAFMKGKAHAIQCDVS